MARPITVTVGQEQVQLRLNDRIHLFKDTWACKRHSNAEFELHMILKGGCELEIEDRHYCLSAGTAVIIPPGQYHLPKTLPGEFGWFTMSFTLGKGALRSALETVRPFCVTGEADRLCQSIFKECSGSDPFRREMLQVLATQLLLEVFRSLELGQESSEEKPADTDENIQKIDDFFERHMADDVSAEALAASLHISRRQLARILQKTYGIGFREKRARTRMEYAAWLLRTTDQPAGRIAEAVGYSSETAFYQAFSRQFGQTPGQYRRAAGHH